MVYALARPQRTAPISDLGEDAHLQSGMRFGIGRIVIVISEAPTAGSLSKDQQGHSNDKQDHGQNDTNDDTDDD